MTPEEAKNIIQLANDMATALANLEMEAQSVLDGGGDRAIGKYQESYEKFINAVIEKVS
jgi:hypothetical protein